METIEVFGHEYNFCTSITQWKREVIRRDDNTCRHCGRTQEQVVLDAHHIFGRYGELAYILENGISFCRQFHRRLKDHPDSGKLESWVRDLVGHDLYDQLQELQKRIKWG